MKRIIGELKAVSVFLPAILVVALVITGINSLKVPTYSGTSKDDKEVAAEAKTKKSLTGKKKILSAAKAAAAKGSPSKLGKFNEKGSYADGTYTGSAQGFQSTITVSVVISKGKISDVSVVSQGETPSYWERAKAVVHRIKRSESTNVDIVSGATYSSNGIINAVRNALRKAQGKSRNISKKIFPKKPKPLPKPPAGGKVYTVKNITVKPDHKKQFDEYPLNNVNIHIKKGKIIGFSKIKWGSKNPVDVLCQKRIETEMLPKVLKTDNYSKIDNVTGATCSADAMKTAIRKAVDDAKKDGNVSKKSDKKKPGKPKKDGKKPKSDKKDGKKPKKPKKPGKPKKPKKPDKKDDKKPENPNEEVFSYTVTNINGEPIRVVPTDYDFGEYKLYSIGVKIKNQKIIDIFDPKWEKSPNNERWQKNAFDQMRRNLVRKGTLDAVAGATCTSTAIRNAADEAMRLHSLKQGG